MGHVRWRTFDWLRGDIGEVRARDGVHQPESVGMLRIVKEGVDGSLLDDPPGVHHRDAIANLGDDTQVVRDQQDAHPVVVLKVTQKRQDLSLDRDVECGCRLVGDQQFRTR